MTKITPTVGRKVWYFPALSEGRGVPDQPLDATVCYVHPSGSVNLACHDQIGQPFTALDVPLFAPEDPDADATYQKGRSIATWMPYQTQQAAKQEKQAHLEATNGLTTIADATAAAAPAATEAPAITVAPTATEAPAATQAPTEAPAATDKPAATTKP